MDATNGFGYPGAGPAAAISVPECPEGYTLLIEAGYGGCQPAVRDDDGRRWRIDERLARAV